MRKLWKSLTVGTLVVLTTALAISAPTLATPTLLPVNSSADAPAQQEQVTLNFIKIADELEAQAFDELVAEFQTIEDGRWAHVSVEYNAYPFNELMTAIQTSVATGQAVDLIQADAPNILNFAADGILAPQTADWTEEELARFAPQSVSEGTANGEFYGPPMRQSCSVMWYNTEMVAAAGIEVPEGVDAVTFEDALAMWQQIAVDENGDGVPEVYGVELGQAPYWGDYEYRTPARTAGEPGSPTYEGVGPNGIEFVGYFDTPEAIEAYRFIQSLYTEHQVAAVEPVPSSFLAEAAAFFISPDRVIGVRNDQFPDMPEIRATNFPYFTTPMCHTGSWHYGIASTTEHYEEAIALVKWLSDDAQAEKYYGYLQQMPANVNVLNALPEWQEYPRTFILEFFNAYGKPRIQTPAYTAYNALHSEFYLSLITGGNVDELVPEYAQLMEASAAQYAGWNE
jgi:fructooligosaccharide transport system substrate-binding protein